MVMEIADLINLPQGDYIEASGLYYKILDHVENGIKLSDPFAKGSVASGEWVTKYDSSYLIEDILHWNHIPRDSIEGKSLEPRHKNKI